MHSQNSWKGNQQIWVRNHHLVPNNLSATLKLSHFTLVWTQAFWSWEREGKTKQRPQERPIPEPPVAQCVKSPHPPLKSLVHSKHIRGLKLSPLNILVVILRLSPCIFFVGGVIPLYKYFPIIGPKSIQLYRPQTRSSRRHVGDQGQVIAAKWFPWNRSVNTHFRISSDMVKCTAVMWDWTCRSLV